MPKRESQKHLEVLKDPDWSMHERRTRTTGEAGKSSVPTLIQALVHERKHIRYGAAVALGNLGANAKEAVPAIIERLVDSDDDVREASAEALGKIGSPSTEAVPILIEMLNDGNKYVRRKVAEALGEIGDVRAVPALIEATQKDNSGLNPRQDAGKALGEIGDPAAVPALIEMLEDEWTSTQQAAAIALRKIGPPAQKAVPALIRSFNDEDENVGIQAGYALGEIGDHDAIFALVDALRGRVAWRRVVAAAALRTIVYNAKTTIPAFFEAFKDIWLDRREAAWLLGEIGDQTTVSTLIDMLDDEDESVRKAAADSLNRINPGTVTTPTRKIQSKKKEDASVPAKPSPPLKAATIPETHDVVKSKSEVTKATPQTEHSMDVNLRPSPIAPKDESAFDMIANGIEFFLDKLGDAIIFIMEKIADIVTAPFKMFKR